MYTIMYIGDADMKKTDDRFKMTDKLGERLRSLRLRAHLTQKELARLVGRAYFGDTELVQKLADSVSV
jgi:hypothetical protein